MVLPSMVSSSSRGGLGMVDWATSRLTVDCETPCLLPPALRSVPPSTLSSLASTHAVKLVPTLAWPDGHRLKACRGVSNLRTAEFAHEQPLYAQKGKPLVNHSLYSSLQGRPPDMQLSLALHEQARCPKKQIVLRNFVCLIRSHHFHCLRQILPTASVQFDDYTTLPS